MNLSAHFTLHEMTFSQFALRTGVPNTPSPEQLLRMTELCLTILEPSRIILGMRALHIDSGYRSPVVNAGVGGESDSAHLEGRASDVIPKGIDLELAFNQLRESALPYDQIIFECRAWIHLSIPRPGATPRRQALFATGVPGKWHYTPIV